MTPKPPRWANQFLEWYCHPDLLEEIQGDVHELYLRNVSRSGERLANLYFIWNVIRFLRWKNIRKTKRQSHHSPIPIDMLKSYLISGMRNILRNLALSSINLVGLALALACGVTIFLEIDSYYNRDTFHEKGERLFLLMNKMKSADAVESWARSPYILGPSLKDENSAIESVVRIQRDRLSVRNGDIVFEERVWFADPEFFNTFSYRLAYGPSTALHDRNNIVLTTDMAIKYFGKTDVVGEELVIKFPNEERVTFTIGAVLDRIPDNSSMSISFLIPMKNWEERINSRPIQWRTWAGSTFVVMKDGHQPEELNTSLKRFIKLQNEANDKFQMQDVEFIPIDKVGERSYAIAHSLSWSNIPEANITLGFVAAFLVLLACFNYMNVAVASVSTRLKEIGIRKVIGGGKKEIIQQFLIENLILCALALGLGTILAYSFILPGYNSLFPVKVPFQFSSSGMMFGFFGGILLLVALISGAYPALYVSSFNPLQILKGKEKFGSKSFFGKVLLSLQFILSFTTIVAGLVFVNSSQYYENKDWGYDHSLHIAVPVNTPQQFTALKDRVAQNKNVVRYAGAESHIGYADHNTTIAVQEQQINVTRFEVGFDYLQTMNVRLKEGRFFDEGIESDKVESAIVNEAFVKKMGWTDPLNKTFEFDSVRWFIVGVVEDFHYNEFTATLEPAFIHIGAVKYYNYLVVKAEAGQVNAVADFLKDSWSAIAPEDPYKGFFQDDVFESFYATNSGINKIMYFVSGVALVLACMGLYGLASYNLTRRLKEFSIRKVFGASIVEIFRLMNRDYVRILLISFGVGAPLGFFMMDTMLKSSYPENIPVKAWPFFLTIGLMIFTMGITITTQLRRVARENPTSTLRND